MLHNLSLICVVKFILNKGLSPIMTCGLKHFSRNTVTPWAGGSTPMLLGSSHPTLHGSTITQMNEHTDKFILYYCYCSYISSDI